MTEWAHLTTICQPLRAWFPVGSWTLRDNERHGFQLLLYILDTPGGPFCSIGHFARGLETQDRSLHGELRRRTKAGNPKADHRSQASGLSHLDNRVIKGLKETWHLTQTTYQCTLHLSFFFWRVGGLRLAELADHLRMNLDLLVRDLSVGTEESIPVWGRLRHAQSWWEGKHGKNIEKTMPCCGNTHVAAEKSVQSL